MNKIRAIIEKEWFEALHNRMVLLTGILLPVMFAGLPLVMLALTRNVPAGQADLQDAPPGLFSNPAYAGFSDVEILQSMLANGMLTLFLIVPLAIPMTIATYSVVGEKREKSLEPLLATPITVTELLLGKAAAAALPGVAAAWLSFAVFIAGARYLVVSDRVYATLLSPAWLLAMLLLAPLLTVLAVEAGLMVSSRATDPRAAEQLGMLIILPVIALLFGQFTGLVFLGTPLVLGGAALLVLLDALLIYLGARLFQRETILTRWK